MSLDDNDISYDGINCTNKDSGYKIGLDELSDLINKDINQSCIGRLKITRFAMMINMDNIQFKDNFNMVVIKNDRVQINMKIINECVKSLAKEVDMDNNCKRLLLFIIFDVSEGMISQFYLEEFHKLDNLPENAVDLYFTSQNNKFSKLSKEKTDNVINTQNVTQNEIKYEESSNVRNIQNVTPNEEKDEESINVRNIQNVTPNEKKDEEPSNVRNLQNLSLSEKENLIFLPGQSEFLNPSQIKVNSIKDIISPLKDGSTVFLFDDEDPFETPKTRFRNTSTTKTRKRKGSKTNEHPKKKKMLSPAM
uniref:ULD domain-containing protein n=1 Tax=Strongyloides papillosus TaxID=174720 RepID=A0A0N5BM71_STREA